MSTSQEEHHLKRSKASKRLINRISSLLPYSVLVLWSLLVLFPILIVVMNSFKTRKSIYGVPFQLPTINTFSLEGYQTVIQKANFPLYFLNSFIVAIVSIFLILFIGALAANALAEYNFVGKGLISFYLVMGIMIPIRLGTVSILKMMNALHLVNTLIPLILVYTASNLPLSIFIFEQFFRQVPKDLKDAGRVDGANEFRIFTLILPVVRPAVGTVATFALIPIWNDLWWPLILAPAEKSKTLVMGAQRFIGQFVTDWEALLAALTLSILPMLLLFLIFSKQLVSGLTKGVLK